MRKSVKNNNFCSCADFRSGTLPYSRSAESRFVLVPDAGRDFLYIGGGGGESREEARLQEELRQWRSLDTTCSGPDTSSLASRDAATHPNSSPSHGNTTSTNTSNRYSSPNNRYSTLT